MIICPRCGKQPQAERKSIGYQIPGIRLVCQCGAATLSHGIGVGVYDFDTGSFKAQSEAEALERAKQDFIQGKIKEPIR